MGLETTIIIVMWLGWGAFMLWWFLLRRRR